MYGDKIHIHFHHFTGCLIFTLFDTLFDTLLNALLVMPLQGDFLVDHKYTFEIGGRDKTSSQIKDTKNSWVVNDDIEAGALHKVPLWRFGMLY